MEALIIFISDLHCKDNIDIPDAKILQINNIIKNHNVDRNILLLGGDIANGGKIIEYDKAIKLIRDISKDIDNFIVLSVPGNHDIEYEPKTLRDRNELKDLTVDFIKENLNVELEKFENYYNFVSNFKNQDIKIETKDELLSKAEIKLSSNKIINIYLLNNAVYSYINLANEDKDNEKGLMHFPFLIDDIESNENIINILLMHFPPEYYNDDSILKFEQMVGNKIHIVFTGHVHRQNAKKELNYKIPFFFSSKEFMNSTDSNSEFIIFKINSGNRKLDSLYYQWAVEEKTYKEKCGKTIDLPVTLDIFESFDFDEDFIEDLYSDELLKTKFYDFFTFPKLEIKESLLIEDTNNKYVKTFKEFQDIIQTYNIIQINGTELSGKSTLLKKIHKEYSNSNIVVFIDGNDVTRKSDLNKIEKFAREQYDKKINLSTIAKQNKILIIDNIENTSLSIKDIALYYSEQFDKIIITKTERSNPIFQEFSDNETLKLSNSIILEIKPFYKKKRDDLISKAIVSLNKTNNQKEVRNLKLEKNISKIIETNLSLFSLDPNLIIMIVKHLYFNKEISDNNIFNEVFKSNIIIQIENVKHKSKVNNIEIYIYVLQKIAFHMTSNKKAFLSYASIESIIAEYNEDYNMKLAVSTFISLLTNANILCEKENNIYFKQENYLAYFSAKEYVSLLNEYDENKINFEQLFQELFYGVNSKILLFIALETQNMKILMNIIKYAQNHFSNSLEIDLGNFPFLTDSKIEIEDFMSNVEKQREIVTTKKEKNEEIIHKQNSRKISFNEKFLNEKEKRLHLGYNYLRLIATILPNFKHKIKYQEQKQIVKVLYELPNKILNEQFEYLNEEKEELIEELYIDIVEKLRENDLNKQIDTSKLKELIYNYLVNIIRAIILGVYDMVFRCSYNDLTEDILEDFEEQTNSHKIQKLMLKSMVSLDKKAEFQEYAIKLTDISNDTHDILLKNCVKLIARRYILDNPEIKFHGTDIKFIRSIFSQKDQIRLLSHRSDTAK